MQTLLNDLRSFKLSGMSSTLSERLSYATSNKLSYQEFLGILCEDERNARRDNNYARRKNASKLPHMKHLEDFDFSFQPSIDQRVINDLATCRFINSKENVVFIGESGTGKTHMSIALGIKALAKEYTVYFTTVSDMLFDLHAAKADNSYYKKLKQIVAYDLLILDELGFREIPKYSADDFFSVIAKRYETKSTIITTNKEVSDWNDIFVKEELTRAITDRVMHYATVLNIRGKSYRMNKTKTGGKDM